MQAMIASTFTGVVIILTAFMLHEPKVMLLMTLAGGLAFVTHLPEVPHVIRLAAWICCILVAVLAAILLLLAL